MGLSILDAAEEYAAALARRGIKYQTIQLYWRELEKLIDHLGEDIDVESITPGHLKSFLLSTRLLKSRQGLTNGAEALGRSKRVCRAFIRWLMEEGHLTALPSSALSMFKSDRKISGAVRSRPPANAG